MTSDEKYEFLSVTICNIDRMEVDGADPADIRLEKLTLRSKINIALRGSPVQSISERIGCKLAPLDRPFCVISALIFSNEVRTEVWKEEYLQDAFAADLGL